MKRFRRNPPLTVFANPPMPVKRLRGNVYSGKYKSYGVISDNVHLVRYTHHDDDKDYEHTFEFADVGAYAVEIDGVRAVLLLGPRDIWDDYPVTMGDFD